MTRIKFPREIIQIVSLGIVTGIILVSFSFQAKAESSQIHAPKDCKIEGYKEKYSNAAPAYLIGDTKRIPGLGSKVSFPVKPLEYSKAMFVVPTKDGGKVRLRKNHVNYSGSDCTTPEKKIFEKNRCTDRTDDVAGQPGITSAICPKE